MNKFDFSPVQIAAIKCHKSCLVTLIKYGDSDSLLALSSCKETLLHLGRIYIKAYVNGARNMIDNFLIS